MEIGKIIIRRIKDASAENYAIEDWTSGTAKQINFTKYNIKETDFRVKTATFTSPQHLDLTTGMYAILISSPYHENFAGVVLDVDYDEDSGVYSYQCQDWSRKWIAKFTGICSKKPLIRVLRVLITRGAVPLKRKATAAELKKNKTALSGLKKTELYDQSLYNGNKYKGNPMYNNVSLLIKDKTIIETIRDLVYAQLGWFDIWFNDKGIIQITPISKYDWEHTGLHLSLGEYYNRKFKFSTTNAITRVMVNGNGLKGGKAYSSEDLLGLDLTAFFGYNVVSVNDPNQDKPKAATTSSSKSTTSNSNMKNPFNNKDKKIIVSADGGSGDFRAGIIGKLEADGWNVKDLGTGPGTHSTSYDILDSSYAVNLTIYNGADPATIAEPVTGWLNHNHKKAGVTLVQMFDTSSWTNPQGMKPYRYGDFSGYYCGKAWDDNYSSGYVDISNLGDWYKKYYPEVVHVCGPSVSEAYEQFKAGGYLKSKGLV